ncbi:hypothetical protein [Selenomonas sp.]|uniref:hypothetical protein n=1 Tax=Selenomonas sp. TaxID=2053611 RepID=UPI002A82126E|nr:hypothetical protein [Selenomonas sp.]MDY4416858.1 hypothetical protein [Selenomonas sp.]
MANRQYKDSVFRMFMNNPVELAKFYQAIRPDTIIRPEDIQINTLEDIMLDQLKHEIMQSFLERCKEEVLQMMTLQWDAEEARRVQEEEYQEELSAATAKSKAEGLAEATMKIIRNLLKKKQLSYKDIADSTDTTVNDVIRIAKESHLAY